MLAAIPADFVPRLLAGVLVDLGIAAQALLLGLACGLPLAALLLLQGPARLAPAGVVQLLRAAPTFVMMFFLLDMLPRRLTIFGLHLAIGGESIVALSLLPYSASYVAVSLEDSVRQWRAGSVVAALLLLPNLTRAYFVLVMSSGAAAAIGVTDGIAVILRQANTLSSLSQRLLLFALGILVFGAILQSGFLAIDGLRAVMTRRAVQRATPSA